MILADLTDEDRNRGLGVVIEYAGAHGKPAWAKSRRSGWDYTPFAQPAAAAAPEEVIPMKHIAPMFHLHQGRRYRPAMRNESDDIHPMHLHRHSFAITRNGGEHTAGIIEDVAMLGGCQGMDVEFIADWPG